MAFAVHALDIAGIVALLTDISRCTRSTDAGEAACQQPGPGANGCAMPTA
jgi:hypothetical protein